jgi:hypothetical protein
VARVVFFLARSGRCPRPSTPMQRRAPVPGTAVLRRLSSSPWSTTSALTSPRIPLVASLRIGVPPAAQRVPLVPIPPGFVTLPPAIRRTLSSAGASAARQRPKPRTGPEDSCRSGVWRSRARRSIKRESGEPSSAMAEAVPVDGGALCERGGALGHRLGRRLPRLVPVYGRLRPRSSPFVGPREERKLWVDPNDRATSHPSNQTKFWLSLTTSHPSNQTKFWLSLTTSHPSNQTEKLAIPNHVVRDILSP